MKQENDVNLQLFLKNRKFLVLTVILVWLSFGLGFFVIKPQIASIFKSKSELDKNRTQLKKLQQKLVELKQIRLSEEFKKKDKVDEVLPSHKPLLELLANLNQAAKKTSIIFTNFEISPGKVASPGAKVKRAAETRKGYNALELELSIRGKEEDVDQFLELVEKIAPLTTITELSINRKDYDLTEDEVEMEVATKATGNNLTVSSADMVMSTYYYTRTVTTTLSKKLPSVGEEEIKIFETIQKFRPSNFEPQTKLEKSELEDIFGVEGLVESSQTSTN
jgi:Tfp pilus assembly protein PilO